MYDAARRKALRAWDNTKDAYHGLKLPFERLPDMEDVIDAFPIPDIPLNFPNISAENLKCEAILGEINQLRRQINTLIRGPMQLLNQIDSAYANLLQNLDKFESSIGDLLKSIDPPNLSIMELYNAFSNMYDQCPFFADSGALDGVLEAFENVANLAEMTTPAFKNALIDDALFQIKEAVFGIGRNALSGTLDSLIKDNVGSISDLQNAYRELLESTGVNAALDYLWMLEKCIKAMCNVGDKFVSTVDQYKKELRLDKKDGSLIDKDKISKKVKELPEGLDLDTQISKAEGAVKSVESSIQKLKDPEFFNIKPESVSEFFNNAASIVKPKILA